MLESSLCLFLSTRIASFGQNAFFADAVPTTRTHHAMSRESPTYSIHPHLLSRDPCCGAARSLSYSLSLSDLFPLCDLSSDLFPRAVSCCTFFVMIAT